MTKETFAALLTSNWKGVRQFVQSRVHIDQVDDIVQQAILRAFIHRDQLRETDKFRNWLWSIAWNEIRLLGRTARPYSSIDEFPNVPDGNPSPLVAFERNEIARRVRAGLAELTERDRTAIRLVDFKGLTAEEAARELAVSKAAFKSTHFRARRRLKHALHPAA
jgi:RNA polymerase sigma-70 factor (ECF subfamily)